MQAISLKNSFLVGIVLHFIVWVCCCGIQLRLLVDVGQHTRRKQQSAQIVGVEERVILVETADAHIALRVDKAIVADVYTDVNDSLLAC